MGCCWCPHKLKLVNWNSNFLHKIGWKHLWSKGPNSPNLFRFKWKSDSEFWKLALALWVWFHGCQVCIDVKLPSAILWGLEWCQNWLLCTFGQVFPEEWFQQPKLSEILLWRSLKLMGSANESEDFFLCAVVGFLRLLITLRKRLFSDVFAPSRGTTRIQKELGTIGCLAFLLKVQSTRLDKSFLGHLNF